MGTNEIPYGSLDAFEVQEKNFGPNISNFEKPMRQASLSNDLYKNPKRRPKKTVEIIDVFDE